MTKLPKLVNNVNHLLLEFYSIEKNCENLNSILIEKFEFITEMQFFRMFSLK